ncbi:LuxR C-terminal-related transcriptional regulator [Myroides odoratimimus]|uniref:LuxR C-terminal-related transcriptional regulator n=1 Tax=Myroides odoratimimus TaxID=76832 RepID=UPI002DBEB2C0|nr:LuxR C-terminal-related transcriptional regulator [Myroides odoratimimus]MEC4054574.1 LuxR C-terminal-related transcriptional regulator [Myroides odoratimimus]
MDLKQIITLHLDGYSNRKIASTLSISRNTVNTYMQLFVASEYSLAAKSYNDVVHRFRL